MVEPMVAQMDAQMVNVMVEMMVELMVAQTVQMMEGMWVVEMEEMQVVEMEETKVESVTMRVVVWVEWLVGYLEEQQETYWADNQVERQDKMKVDRMACLGNYWVPLMVERMAEMMELMKVA